MILAINFILFGLCTAFIGYSVSAFYFKKNPPHIYPSMFMTYPCDVHMRYALKFLRKGDMNNAYSECCYALLKSGYEFNKEEMDYWKSIEQIETDK